MHSNDGAADQGPTKTGSELVARPEDVTFDGVTERLRDDKVGWLEKCALARERTKAVVAVRKKQYLAAAKVADMANQAQVTMAARAIALRRDEFEFEIRNAYIKMLEALGGKVEIDQLKFVATFAQDLATFEEQLATMKMRSAFREKILGKIGTAFDRLEGKLEQMTKDVIDKARKE